MLSILGRPQRVCNGLTRRRMLEVGGAGLFGVSLPNVLAAEAGDDLFRIAAHLLLAFDVLGDLLKAGFQVFGMLAGARLLLLVCGPGLKFA